MPNLDAWISAVASAIVVLLMWPRSRLTRLSERSQVRLGFLLPPGLRSLPGAMALRTRVWIGVLAGGSAGWWGSSWGMGLALVLALASSVVLTIALGRVEPGAVTHRRRRLGAELPQALRLMAACLEAGLPLRSAVGAVAGVVGGPVSEELQPVLAQIAIGVAERDAWAGFGDHPVLGSVAKDLSRAVEAGTGVQAILVQRAAELRAEHRSAVQERARAVGVRSVLPLSLCFLPAFMLLGVVPAVAGMIAPILAP